ncbi:damage-inducible protein [Afifella sp. H1R]|uniref:ImuA family protein n=1 Tax=Afifella sp. H1R TaxID=2908841 RepID=UPI001F1E5DCD|nr:damage-inducible protein [Afifella sp. H1R]MCF1504721.1 damage-inducible protein [Afifella sp. H1R]
MVGAQHDKEPGAGWRAAVLKELRREVGALEAGARPDAPALAFEAEAIDAHLPEGGLRLGALHEIWGGSALPIDRQAPEGTNKTGAGGIEKIGGNGGAEDIAAATLFLAGLLARLSGPVLWCLKARDLFTPSLAAAGLDPDRVIYAETWHERDVLAAMEEGLHHAGLAAVVGEVARLGLTASRRLQLAAESEGVTAFTLLRPHRQTGAEPTAAATRWRIRSAPSLPLMSSSSAAHPVAGIGRGRWRVDLMRCRGADPVSFITEACDGTGRLGVSALLRDGADAPHLDRSAA